MSLKVIGTDTDQSATHDFLLVFRSDSWPSISYRDKWRYCTIFPTPVYLTVVPLKTLWWRWGPKN